MIEVRMEPNKRVGELMAKVREARLEAAKVGGKDAGAFSQEAVAKHFGRTQSWISNIENGERGITAVQFFSWAEFMVLTEDEWTAFRETGCLTEDEIDARKRASDAA